MTSDDETEKDPRWRRVLARDRSADGQFWYSVATTGVYCRPSCPSRAANPKNVRLHATLQAAKATGFRPCQRCDPDGQGGEAVWVAQACRLIENSAAPPSLTELAKACGLSASHLQRRFKAVVGLTPKAFAQAHRGARVRDALREGKPVTAAIFDAGFNSSAGFYQQAAQMLGMTATSLRSGGAGEEIRFAVGQASLGAVLVASSVKGVVAIMLGDDPATLLRALQDQFAKARLIGGDAAYEALVAQVVACVEAPALGLSLPLDIRGTAFQQRVWQALREIPAGLTLSYAQLAAKIGAPKAVRAVAGACAQNNIAVAIPCHRVVRQNGELSGYRWGVARKRALLDREREA